MSPATENSGRTSKSTEVNRPKSRDQIVAPERRRRLPSSLDATDETTVQCHFGRVSGDVLLAFDRDVDERTQLPVAGWTTPRNCFRCRQRRACCRCNRQLHIVGGVWPCWHCLELGFGERAFDGSNTNGNAISVSKGQRADITNSDVILNSAQRQASPKTVNRECPGGPLVNRAPGGNWWGSRGASSGCAAVSAIGLGEGSTNSESYEFFHYCHSGGGGDEAASDAVNVAGFSSQYAVRYRQRHTVSNVGSVPFGEITLNDLEPDEDPYLRKFRSCGDFLSRLQLLLHPDDQFSQLQTLVQLRELPPGSTKAVADKGRRSCSANKTTLNQPTNVAIGFELPSSRMNATRPITAVFQPNVSDELFSDAKRTGLLQQALQTSQLKKQCQLQQQQQQQQQPDRGASIKILVSTVDPTFTSGLPPAATDSGQHQLMTAATKIAATGTDSSSRLTSNRRSKAQAALSAAPRDLMVKSKTAVAFEGLGTSGSSCDEEPSTTFDLGSCNVKKVSMTQRRRRGQHAASNSKAAQDGAVVGHINLGPFSESSPRRLSGDLRPPLIGKSLTTVGFNVDGSDNAIGKISSLSSRTGNACCSSSLSERLGDAVEFRCRPQQQKPFASFGDQEVNAVAGQQRLQLTLPDAKRSLERQSTQGLAAAAALTGRQFQTIASRLQLAVVRPPADISLLVRLT